MSGFNLEANSPLKLLDSWAEQFSESEAFSRSIMRLYGAGYIWKRKDGKADVNLALLPALLVMMQPEEVTLFFSLKYIQSSEHYFLKRSKTIVHYSPSLDFKIHSFSYPWTLKLMRDWLWNEIRMRTRKPTTSARFTISLQPGEFLILEAIQYILRSRFEQEKKLTVKRSQVTYRDLEYVMKDPHFLSLLKRFPALRNMLDELTKQPYLIGYIIRNLEEKELIRRVSKSTLTYTKLSRQLFDPGLIVDFGIAYYESRRPSRRREYSLIYHEDKILLFDITRKRMNLRVLGAKDALKFLERAVFPCIK